MGSRLLLNCCYYGGAVRREFSRGVDLDVSGRDIFGYEEVGDYDYNRGFC